MKTKKIINVLALICCFSAKSFAQTDVDALRYSGSSITGTARYTAMSGAFGALGGDFSSLSNNPAGIAVYRTSEFTFSPSIYVGSTSSNFLGQTFDQHKFNFNIGNAGLVFTKKITDSNEGWQSWNFGLGYNRTDNFQNRSYFSGRNNSNSLLDNFVEIANGTNPGDLSPFYESLAYNDSLINPDSSNIYSSVIPAGKEIQRQTTEMSGATGETVFTFGGNYSNKLFLGATVGIKSLRYVENKTYEEIDPDSSIANFNRFRFDQNFTTHGTGVNIKFGMIYKVNDLFRFGFSFESPTWYSMHDDYTNAMTSYFDTGIKKTYSSVSPEGYYDYNFTSPLKAGGSIAFIFNNYGLISADYQFSDYGEPQFSAADNSFSDVNNTIIRKYNVVHAIKVGTEWKLQNVSLRGGVSYSTSPLNSQFVIGNNDFTKTGFSGGIGFRQDNLFFDLGYVYSISNQLYQPYTLQSGADVPSALTKLTSSNFVITMGVKF